LPGRSIRCCEKCRRLAEDLVRPPELRVLPLQRLEPYSLVGGEPRTLTHVHHPAPHPVPQGLRRAADPRGDGENGSPLGFVLVLVLEDEPHRALTDFRRKGCSTLNLLRLAPNLSQVGASCKPGVVHSCISQRFCPAQRKHRKPLSPILPRNSAQNVVRTEFKHANRLWNHQVADPTAIRPHAAKPRNRITRCCDINPERPVGRNMDT